jgi:lactate dehydrogenase-like 2-hydroxyacid dehydrogenase
MNLPRLLVMNRTLEKLVQPPETEFELVRLDAVDDQDGFLAANGAGIEMVLASGGEKFDAARLELLPDLKLIAAVAAGIAGIDLDAARARRIAVTSAGDLNSADVADFAITLMLAHIRDLFANDRFVRDGHWTGGRRPMGRSVGTQRVGIVGMGNIGQAIAARLAPFGADIAWWGPRAKPDLAWARMETLEELAAWSTVLIVAARGDDTTRGLISASVIKAVGPEGLIVNVSRGYVIDEPAMIGALKDGSLGGAGLDVFVKEPNDGADWANVPNVILAPHVASSTTEAFTSLMAGALDNLRRHVAGQPLLHRAV